MVIAIDFDGTCVTHDFPEMGKDIGAAPVLKRLVAQGYKLVLFTTRSDWRDKRYLSDAVEWFRLNDIPLYGVQVNPTQQRWTNSPKVAANLYIDDAGFGCPLIRDSEYHRRPFVDWEEVERRMEEDGFFSEDI